MKYYSEEQIRDQFDPFECEAFFKRQDFGSINVRRCCDCPLFQPNDIQIEKPIVHGWCTRYYTRVTTEDFCREDRIKDEVL